MNDEPERFAPEELAIVLSHYDLGVLDSAKEFQAGSCHAPKLLLESPKGKFLLKRRAAGKNDPFRVAFAHALIAHLREKGFPCPAVVSPRDQDTSLLRANGHVYEVFEYVEGARYDGSLKQTARAGLTLAAFHDAVVDFHTEWDPPTGSYHDSSAVRSGLIEIPTAASGHDSALGREAELLQLAQELHASYDEAADAVRAELEQTEPTIIHGDWHPGNLLFRGERIVAVLDLDAARLLPSVVDVASAITQFSIVRSDSAPDAWPERFDEQRIRAFAGGYETVRRLGDDERGLIPDLMVESLVAEAALPIAQTGSLGRHPGLGVLRMIAGKIRWLRQSADEIRVCLGA